MAPVCNFFLRGQCKFGDSCRNEHPVSVRQNGFGGQRWTNSSHNQTSDSRIQLPFSQATMKADLTAGHDKPSWPLSSYAPAKHEPLLLAGLDESPEELRVRAVLALKSGNVNEYLTYESSKMAAAEQTYNNALSNISQVFEQAAKQSPITAMLTGQPGATTAISPFHAPAAPSAIGSSVFGNTPSTPSAFGITSVFSNTSKPSTFATSAPSSSTAVPGNPVSVFGTTTATGLTPSTSTFGQPASGQPVFGQTGFQQTSSPAVAPTFGGSANTQMMSAFGQGVNAPGTSVFGQPSQPTSAFGQSAFGQPGFGQPSMPSSFNAFATSGTSPMAFSAFANQPSTFTTAANTTSPTPGSVIGQPSFNASSQPPAVSAFATPAFGQPAVPVSTFGAFAGSASGSAGAPQSAIANPTAPPISAFGSTTASAFAHTVSISKSASGALASPNFTGAVGPQQFLKASYDEQLPPNYMELIPQVALEAFKAEKLRWGKVPEWIPPLEHR